MIGRKVRLSLLCISLTIVGMLSLTPAQAGGFTAKLDDGALPAGAPLGVLSQGNPPTTMPSFVAGSPASQIAAGCGDALDPLATQSRLAAVYQKKAANSAYTDVLDISKYIFQAGKKLDGSTNDPGYINAAVQLCGPAATQVTDIPVGYSDITYYWVFQDLEADGPQNSPQITGFNCTPTRFNDLGPTSDQRISAFRYPASTSAADKCVQVGSFAAELAGTATTPLVATQDKADTSSGNFTTRTADRWYQQINVSFAPEVQGTTAILKGRWTYGVFEEFSQIYTSIDAVINTQQSGNAGGYVKTGSACSTAAGTGAPVGLTAANLVCVRVPYAPRLDNSPDDDRLIDEKRRFPIVNVGDQIQFFAVSAFGTRQVGTPFPVCPFSPVYPNPQGNPVALPGYPQSLPQADGGAFCRQGFVGLLSGVDWAPNSGFEGRAVPRSPSLHPNPRTTDTDWLQCQYPAGSNTFGVTAAPIITIGGPVDLNSGEFWISPQYQSNPPVQEVHVSSTKQLNPPDGIPPQNTVPEQVVTGKNVSCGYSVLDTGLHYKNPGTAFKFPAS